MQATAVRLSTLGTHGRTEMLDIRPGVSGRRPIPLESLRDGSQGRISTNSRRRRYLFGRL